MQIRGSCKQNVNHSSRCIISQSKNIYIKQDMLLITVKLEVVSALLRLGQTSFMSTKGKVFVLIQMFKRCPSCCLAELHKDVQEISISTFFFNSSWDHGECCIQDNPNNKQLCEASPTVFYVIWRVKTSAKIIKKKSLIGRCTNTLHQIAAITKRHQSFRRTVFSKTDKKVKLNEAFVEQ